MPLRCHDSRVGAGLLLAVALAALAACSREDRRFDDPLSAAARGITMTDLQAGPSSEPPLTTLGPYRYNAHAISQGKRLFDWYNCSGCHGHGGGDSGPAMMDEHWIYGSAPANIFATVVEGRPNGMPAYRGRLNEMQVWQLVAYVESLTGRLSRDALPARNDHLSARPGEQSLPPLPATQSTVPPASRQ
jgi:cytochrome c oxidase cbb3-type subunit 3